MDYKTSTVSYSGDYSPSTRAAETIAAETISFALCFRKESKRSTFALIYRESILFARKICLRINLVFSATRSMHPALWRNPKDKVALRDVQLYRIIYSGIFAATTIVWCCLFLQKKNYLPQSKQEVERIKTFKTINIFNKFPTDIWKHQII